MDARRTSIVQGRASDAGGALAPSLGLSVRDAREALRESTTTLREKSARGDQVKSTFSAVNSRSLSP